MDDPQVASAFGGAKYGAAAGLVAAAIVVNESFPFSVFPLQPGFVFGYWIGMGMAVMRGTPGSRQRPMGSSIPLRSRNSLRLAAAHG